MARTEPPQVDAESNEVWSYRTLLREVVQVATTLSEDGLGPGDTIAFFSRNYHELYSSVLACVMAGITAATMVPTHGAGAHQPTSPPRQTQTQTLGLGK